MRDVAQALTELVPEALLVLGARRHAVGLVHNDEIPVALPEAREDLLSLGEIERRQDMAMLLPRIDPVLHAKVRASEHHELFVELLPKLALPLEGQVRRRHDQDPIG